MTTICHDSHWGNNELFFCRRCSSTKSPQLNLWLLFSASPSSSSTSSSSSATTRFSPPPSSIYLRSSNSPLIVAIVTFHVIFVFVFVLLQIRCVFCATGGLKRSRGASDTSDPSLGRERTLATLYLCDFVLDGVSLSSPDRHDLTNRSLPNSLLPPLDVRGAAPQLPLSTPLNASERRRISSCLEGRPVGERCSSTT